MRPQWSSFCESWMARKPAMGKIYDRMFMIGQKIKASDVSWKAEAENIHADRWEYLHSEMHSAGFGFRSGPRVHPVVEKTRQRHTKWAPVRH